MTSRLFLPFILLLSFIATAAAPAVPNPVPNMLSAEPAVAPLDSAPFGLNTHLATRYTELDSMNVAADVVAQSGAGWAREDIHWWRIQPSPGVWDWSYTDQAMRLLIQRNIKILGVLGHPPGWATPYSGDAAEKISFYAPDPVRFAEFSRAVVARYGKYIDHWEVWNEPDNVLFWKPAPNPEDYATLLEQTSVAIRATDPDAKILLGGINPFDTEFLRRVAEAGAWDSFDITAIHPYVDPGSPEAGNIGNSVDGVRILADRYGQKPIWATEVGWSTGPGDHDAVGIVDEQEQANYLVRSLLLLWRSGVERSFWYALKDDPGNPYGLVALGAGRDDYSTLKPSFKALRALSQQVGGAELMHSANLFTQASFFDFETFGAWRRGDQPYGTISAIRSTQHSGQTAAELDYDFPSTGNDYVVFVREQPIPIPETPYALGLWVYGDGSGNQLKVWLRDAEGELLQYTLGGVGPVGWHQLRAPIGRPVASWDRINKTGNGVLDFPASVYAVVLDDAPDSFRGGGTIYLDELTTISGPEAYDLQLRRGDDLVDVLWAPEEAIRARLPVAGSGAAVVERDGQQQTVVPRDGVLSGFEVGPAPRFVVRPSTGPASP